MNPLLLKFPHVVLNQLVNLGLSQTCNFQNVGYLLLVLHQTASARVKSMVNPLQSHCHKVPKLQNFVHLGMHSFEKVLKVFYLQLHSFGCLQCFWLEQLLGHFNLLLNELDGLILIINSLLLPLKLILTNMDWAYKFLLALFSLNFNF